MSPIKELDSVVLTRDVPEHHLRQGDVGAVVMSHRNGEAFELEFVGYDGHTVALFTAPASWVRAVKSSDIPHARDFAAA